MIIKIKGVEYSLITTLHLTPDGSYIIYDYYDEDGTLIEDKVLYFEDTDVESIAFIGKE